MLYNHCIYRNNFRKRSQLTWCQPNCLPRVRWNTIRLRHDFIITVYLCVIIRILVLIIALTHRRSTHCYSIPHNSNLIKYDNHALKIQSNSFCVQGVRYDWSSVVKLGAQCIRVIPAPSPNKCQRFDSRYLGKRSET